MAMQSISVPFTAASVVTFTFNKPQGTYGKGGGIPTADGPAVPWYSNDVDNLDGTMTGTLNFSGPITGSVLITVYDT